MENLRINKKAKIGKYVLRGKALTLAVATALLLLGCSVSEAEVEVTPTATIAATATPKPTPKITPTPSPTPYTKMGAIKDIAKKKYREYLNAISPLNYRENSQYIYTLEDFENATCYMRRHYLTYGDESKVIVTDPNMYMVFCWKMSEVTKKNYKKDGRIVFLNFSDYYEGEEFKEEREILSRLEKLYEENPEEAIKEYTRFACKYFYDDSPEMISPEKAAFVIAYAYSLDQRLYIWNETTNSKEIWLPESEIFPWDKQKSSNGSGLSLEVKILISGPDSGFADAMISKYLGILEEAEQVGEVKR